MLPLGGSVVVDRGPELVDRQRDAPLGYQLQDAEDLKHIMVPPYPGIAT